MDVSREFDADYVGSIGFERPITSPGEAGKLNRCLCSGPVQLTLGCNMLVTLKAGDLWKHYPCLQLLPACASWIQMH